MKLGLFFAAVLSASALYDPAEGVRGWDLVNAAYCSPNAIFNWNCPNCKTSGITLTEVSVYSTAGCQAFVGYSVAEDRIYLSFRGSSNIPNWIANLDAVLTSYPLCNKCYVHTGFYKEYLTLAKDVRYGVLLLASKYNAKLRIYGHSLGGSMAVHAAADLQDEIGLTAEWVYTYGQPRVGNSAFHDWYNSVIPEHYRVTHSHDIVPSLPPPQLGFDHVSQEIFYPRSPPTYIVCDGTGEDPQCQNSQVNLDIEDHLTYMGGDCCCDDLSFTTNYTKNSSIVTSNTEEDVVVTSSNTEAFSATDECKTLDNCGSCISNACAWCTYQSECHQVGSLFNPCPPKACISTSILSQCLIHKCPPFYNETL